MTPSSYEDAQLMKTLTNRVRKYYGRWLKSVETASRNMALESEEIGMPLHLRETSLYSQFIVHELLYLVSLIKWINLLILFSIQYPLNRR